MYALGGWVGPTAGLNISEEEKNFFRLPRGRTPGHLSRNLLTVWMTLFRQHTEGRRILGLFGILKHLGVNQH
jgi:hypothetical protein